MVALEAKLEMYMKGGSLQTNSTYWQGQGCGYKPAALLEDDYISRGTGGKIKRVRGAFLTKRLGIIRRQDWRV